VPRWLTGSGLGGARRPSGSGQSRHRSAAARPLRVRAGFLKLCRFSLHWPRLRPGFRHHASLDPGDARLPFCPSPDLRRPRLTGSGLPGSAGRRRGSGLAAVDVGHDLTGEAIRRRRPLQQHRVFDPAIKKNLLELAARRQAPRQLGVPLRGGQHAARRACGFASRPAACRAA